MGVRYDFDPTYMYVYNIYMYLCMYSGEKVLEKNQSEPLKNKQVGKFTYIYSTFFMCFFRFMAIPCYTLCKRYLWGPG